MPNKSSSKDGRTVSEPSSLAGDDVADISPPALLVDFDCVWQVVTCSRSLQVWQRTARARQLSIQLFQKKPLQSL